MASFLWSLLLTLLKEDDETKSAEKDFYVKNTFLQMIMMVLILHYEARGITKKMPEKVNEVVDHVPIHFFITNNFFAFRTS